MNKKTKSAKNLHKNVPSNWYYKSIYVDKNILQKFVHNRRFKEVGKFIEPAGGKLLDIGSADGIFTKVILDKSKANLMIGVDVLEHSVDWAKKHWKKEKKLQFEVADAHELSFKSASFDAVFAIEVLEHVYEPVAVLKEIKRVLKKNGYAVFLVPAETLLFRVIWFFWTKGKGKVWKGTHVHAYSGDFLVQLAKAVGFKIEEEKKIIFGTLHLIKVRKK
jgi:ubiquinone/menaquinone biosynthesis C-methylase UbiE